MKFKNFLIFIFLLAISALISIFYPKSFIIFLAWFITILYSSWGVYHLIILWIGLKKPFEPKYEVKNHPKISVIIPARNEPILGRTIETIINHVDYPLNKKEIVIVTEDPLCERIALWYQQKYPNVVKLLKREEYFLTKPSALNDALHLCKGDIIGIVDVEDIVEKDLFIKVACAIDKHGYDVVQAILRISNENDSWITKIFSMEYAGWFRIFLNGRSKLKLFTPLGGSGNYFKKRFVKEVGGWDSLNLTEDAELTVRFNIAKCKSTVINARQWEEAPVNFKTWLKQRTRWFRGWMQTLWKYFLFMLKPWVFKRIGFINLISIILMLINPIIVIFNWIAYSLTFLWLLEYFKIISTDLLSNTFPFWALIPLTFNFIYYYCWLKGAVIEKVRKKNYLLIPHIFFYLNVMMPIASLRALYQEIFKPIVWEKTEHPGKGVKWFFKI